jgi:hypothetical protein
MTDRPGGTTANEIELPPHWTSTIRGLLRQEGDRSVVEIASLPSALALGAPARLTIALRFEAARATLVVAEVKVGNEFVRLAALREAWAPYWIASIRQSLEGEVRRRRSTREMAIPKLDDDKRK